MWQSVQEQRIDSRLIKKWQVLITLQNDRRIPGEIEGGWG